MNRGVCTTEFAVEGCEFTVKGCARFRGPSQSGLHLHCGSKGARKRRAGGSASSEDEEPWGLEFYPEPTPDCADPLNIAMAYQGPNTKNSEAYSAENRRFLHVHACVFMCVRVCWRHAGHGALSAAYIHPAPSGGPGTPRGKAHCVCN
eukprot:1183350-Prorocentrum_minimum.AAC.3